MTPFFFVGYARDQFADRDTRTRLVCRSRRGLSTVQSKRRSSKPLTICKLLRICDSCFGTDIPRKTASHAPNISIFYKNRDPLLTRLDLINLIRAHFRANIQRKFPSIRNNWDWQLKELCQFVSSKCETPREKPSHSKFTNRISISRSRLPRIPSCDAVGVELSSLIRDQMKREHCMSSQFWLYLHFYAE